MNLADGLAARTLALVDIPSVSEDEGAILEALEVPAGFPVVDAQDTVRFFGPPLRRPTAPFVVLAGHVDTVPVNRNLPGSRDDRGVRGVGAADMKGSLAVMERVAAAVATGEIATEIDLGLLFFGREELPFTRSALLPLFARCPQIAEIDLAVVMEPTDNVIEVGCLGNLNVRVVVEGESAHTARPWLGRNAIHRAVEIFAPLAATEPIDVTVGGLTFREVLSVTTIAGGHATNVIPDRVEAHVNYRYAPGTAPQDAEARLRELLPGASVEVVGNAPPGPVVVDDPLVERLRVAAGLDVRPKQAWTPVAEFATIGVNAVNLGPGDPGYAHRQDERVDTQALVRSYEVLRAFLSLGEPLAEGA